ncbi:hypothetical protein KAH27_04660 [bacterium]|nr:hypothetical protein [bacterium]
MFGFDKNAFAVPVAKHDHTELINKIANSVVQRRMAMPVTLLIESCKPINRIASQFMLVISPLLALFVSYDQIDALSDMLQDKKCVEKLLSEIEIRNNA